MRTTPASPRILLTGLFFLCLFLGLLTVPVSAAGPAPVPDERPTVYLLYASSGTMSQLLNTHQIDATVIWESVVSTIVLSQTGRMVATAQDFPPNGSWAGTASCVVVLRDSFIRKNPEISGLLYAITQAGINRVNEDPSLAENITAAWVFGSKPILTPKGKLEPLAVEEHAFPNIVFTSEAALPSVSFESTPAIDQPGRSEESDPVNVSQVVELGQSYLNGTNLPDFSNATTVDLSIGYLPSSDLFAPLYVAVQDSEYFCDRYSFCLMPVEETSRPSYCILVVNGEAVAAVSLVPAQSGGGMMTTLGQNAIDCAFVGSVPALQQIAGGNPSTIIMATNTGGTGLVVDPRAPCTNWSSFISYAKLRSFENRPLVIATVQSSIQETMIRGALEQENFRIVLYGTNIEVTS